MKNVVLLMAVDLGTSFIKTAVYDTDSNLIAETSAPVKSLAPAAGIFIQKGDDIIGTLTECIAATVKKTDGRAKDICSIGFSGQMAGTIGVGENWEDITSWSCSMDSRYMPYAEKTMEEHGDRFMEICGTSSPVMGPKDMWFAHEFPEEHKKIKKYTGIIGYAIGRLSGCPVEEAVIDSTVLMWTGLGDLEKGKWSGELCKYCSMDEDLLPKIVHSTDICGHLSADMAEKTGLPKGIPLVSGAGDKIAGCVGANVLGRNEAVFEAASFGAITVRLEEFRPDLKTRCFDMIPSAVPGEFFGMNYMIGSGMTIDWFHGLFSGSGRPAPGEYRKLDELAETVRPGCGGLMAIGLLGGYAFPVDGTYKGMWMGFDWSHRKEHFYRALLESISYDFALVIQRMQDLYPELEIKDIKLIGGGSASKLWNQMNADITGIEYRKLDRNDAALWGAAMLGGAAAGVISDIRTEGAKHVYVTEKYMPDPERHEIYKEYLEQYKQYRTELRPYFAALKNR